MNYFLKEKKESGFFSLASPKMRRVQDTRLGSISQVKHKHHCLFHALLSFHMIAAQNLSVEMFLVLILCFASHASELLGLIKR